MVSDQFDKYDNYYNMHSNCDVLNTEKTYTYLDIDSIVVS